MSYINKRKFLGFDYNGIYKPILFDIDAQAYFNVNTAITSDADKNAINTFYLGLKSDGLYTKLKAMYLPLWLTSANCKWNLINPLDTNAANRLNFSTGFTYSAQGVTGNGTSAYADTFINSQTGLTNNANFVAVYSRTTAVNVECELGTYDATTPTFLQLRAAANFVAGTTATTCSFTTTTDAKGFWIGVKRANNDRQIYRNGVSQATNLGNDAAAYPNCNLLLWARNAINYVPSGPQVYSSKQLCFFAIGNNSSLTNTETLNFSNRVNTLMTYFGINTY